MGLSNELSCETGSFFHHCSPHRFLQSEVLKLYFPALESWVTWFVSLPSCSSRLIHMQMWNCLVHQLLSCHESSLPQLPFSTHPTGLDECFFFNSFTVRFPYSSIFWQFWLFFVFKLLLSSFDCVRKQNISTYSSILTGSPVKSTLTFKERARASYSLM